VQSLRALDTVILMGKNTLMKRCLKVYIENTGNDKWQVLYDQLLGNVGLVFTSVRA
jgi:large subunit ribosomal protein LP0